MRTWKSSDGEISITWGGDLQEKIAILDSLGIVYTPTQEELNEESNIRKLNDEYIDTITELQKIENSSNSSNAEVIRAIKFLAKTLRLILNLLKMQYIQ